MKLNPLRIYEDFENGSIDESSLINLIISIVEEQNDDVKVLESFDVLRKVASKDKLLFKFLENITISDEREFVREEAIDILSTYFLQESLIVFKWAINHEMSYPCLFKIIYSLAKLNTVESRQILKEKIKKIRKIKYLNQEKGYENNKFRKGIKRLLKSNKIHILSQKQLSEILINFYTIKNLIGIFPNIFFEINQNCLIKELDLSDYLEYEVKGTPWGWKNNIESISLIVGIENLKKLENLNLSNNNIKDIKDLVKIKDLVYLNLSNNKISNPNNIQYLKQLSNLEFVDLRGNEISQKINNSEFNTNSRILKENSLDKLEETFENRLKK